MQTFFGTFYDRLKFEGKKSPKIASAELIKKFIWFLQLIKVMDVVETFNFALHLELRYVHRIFGSNFLAFWVCVICIRHTQNVWPYTDLHHRLPKPSSTCKNGSYIQIGKSSRKLVSTYLNFLYLLQSWLYDLCKIAVLLSMVDIFCVHFFQSMYVMCRFITFTYFLSEYIHIWNVMSMKIANEIDFFFKIMMHLSKFPLNRSNTIKS